MKLKDATLLNGLALAYMGDAIYEVHIREHLLKSGQTKPKQLHQMATKYVSAKAQSFLVEKMLEESILSDEEQNFFKRGRNAKSFTKAKNTDVSTYKASTGFESVFGYLHLTGQTERITELVDWCIHRVDGNDKKE